MGALWPELLNCQKRHCILAMPMQGTGHHHLGEGASPLLVTSLETKEGSGEHLGLMVSTKLHHSNLRN